MLNPSSAESGTGAVHQGTQCMNLLLAYVTCAPALLPVLQLTHVILSHPAPLVVGKHLVHHRVDSVFTDVIAFYHGCTDSIYHLCLDSNGQSFYCSTDTCCRFPLSLPSSNSNALELITNCARFLMS